jgi:hypothetical protein
MNDYVERLPVRIAALAGILVGIVSWRYGTGELACLERIAVAMAVFGPLGVALRALLRSAHPREETTHVEHEIDTVTPEMDIESLAPRDRGRHASGPDWDNPARGRGDQGEKR